MKKYFVLQNSILVLMFFFKTGLPAQPLSPTVVSTSGGFYSNAAGMLSFTTGEMSAIETHTTPNTILTQGFQQPYDSPTLVTTTPQQPFSYSIYPNPSNGDFDLLIITEKKLHILLTISNLLGNEIQTFKLDPFEDVHIHSIHVTALPGIYIATFKIKDKDTCSQYLASQKIQIID